MLVRPRYARDSEAPFGVLYRARSSSRTQRPRHRCQRQFSSAVRVHDLLRFLQTHLSFFSTGLRVGPTRPSRQSGADGLPSLLPLSFPNLRQSVASEGCESAIGLPRVSEAEITRNAARVRRRLPPPFLARTYGCVGGTGTGQNLGTADGVQSAWLLLTSVGAFLYRPKVKKKRTKIAACSIFRKFHGAYTQRSAQSELQDVCEFGYLSLFISSAAKL